MKIEENLTYTVDELSQILKMGKRTVQSMLKDGKIKSKNIGTDKRAIYRVRGGDIIDYLTK